MTRTKPKARANRPSLGVALTRRQAAWVRRTSKIFDEVEKMDPADPKLKPFKTKNWVDKGFMLGRPQGRSPNLPVGWPSFRGRGDATGP